MGVAAVLLIILFVFRFKKLIWGLFSPELAATTAVKLERLNLYFILVFGLSVLVGAFLGRPPSRIVDDHTRNHEPTAYKQSVILSGSLLLRQRGGRWVRFCGESLPAAPIQSGTNCRHDSAFLLMLSLLRGLQRLTSNDSDLREIDSRCLCLIARLSTKTHVNAK